MKRNWALISFLLIVFLSVCTRFWSIESLGLSHGDAGNFIRMSTWMIGEFGRPMYWEPPVYPISIAIAFMLFGVLDYVAIGATAMYGVLLVISMFLFGRYLYDEKTGTIASFFTAVSAFFIINSRHLVVDGVLTFFMTVSLFSFFIAFRERKMLYYVIYGFLAGITFLTKYIGVFVFFVPATFGILYYISMSIKNRFKWKDFLFDLKGIIIVAVIMALMHIPWIYGIGIGVYASSGGNSYFSLKDVNIEWMISNSAEVIQLGLIEYYSYFMFLSDVVGNAHNTANPIYYIDVILVWTSPLLVLLFLLYTYNYVKNPCKEDSFLYFWFIFFFVFLSLIMVIKGSRFILAAMPPFIIIASKGVQSLKRRDLILLVLALTVVSCMLISLDSITSYHDGYKNVGRYISQNVVGDDLIFYTGWSQLLFYHELDTGNWWEHDETDRTSEVTYVIVDSLGKDSERLSFFDFERFENDFSPVAVFENVDHMRETDARIAGMRTDHIRPIKVYKVDEDISRYFDFQKEEAKIKLTL